MTLPEEGAAEEGAAEEGAALEAEQSFVDTLVEVLHTLSARVTWPNDHNRHVFESRLEELKSFGRDLEEKDVLPDAAGGDLLS